MDVLVEFRVGKMTYVDKRLNADPRKGTLRVAQDEHGLTHLLWLERDAAEPEMDVIVFPGEATFEKIDRPGARVFLLKFQHEADRNLFFWAQEPDASQDEDYVTAVNNLMNAELEDMEVAGEEEPAAAAVAPQQQLAAGAGAGLGESEGAGGGAIKADMLASVLSNIMSGASGSALQQQQQQQAAAAAMAMGPSLGDVLKPEAVVPLLQSADMVERLAPFLPEQQRSREAITELVSSPQFRHQLALFSHALMTGQLDISQFGLRSQGFGVLDFLKALQQQVDEEAVSKAAQQQQQQPAQPEPEGSAPQEGQQQ